MNFYSLGRRTFFSRNLICLHHACVQLFRAKIFAFRGEKTLVESGLRCLSSLCFTAIYISLKKSSVFTVFFCPGCLTLKVRDIIRKNFHILKNDPETSSIFSKPISLFSTQQKHSRDPRSTYTRNRHHLYHNFTCTSTHLIYCISCSRCGMLYIGETGRQY